MATKNTERTGMVHVDGLDKSVPEHAVQVRRKRRVTILIEETSTVHVKAPDPGVASAIVELSVQANQSHMTWYETAPVDIGPNDGETVDLVVGPSHVTGKSK